jgi:hypothetical protein
MTCSDNTDHPDRGENPLKNLSRRRTATAFHPAVFPLETALALKPEDSVLAKSPIVPLLE